MYYEIYLCSYQPDGFFVKAGSIGEAVDKVVETARTTVPGVFDENGKIKEDHFPLVYEIKHWN